MDNSWHKGSYIWGHSPPHLLENIQLHGGRDAIGDYSGLVLLLHFPPPSALPCTHVCWHWLGTEGWFRAGLAARWARTASQSLGQTFPANQGLAKSIGSFLLVVSKHRRDAGLMFKSDMDEGRKPNVAQQPSQFCSPKTCPVLHTASSALDVAVIERIGHSPEGSPSLFMEPISSQSSASKKVTGALWDFSIHNVLLVLSCRNPVVQTFLHQPLWWAKTASLHLQYPPWHLNLTISLHWENGKETAEGKDGNLKGKHTSKSTKITKPC